MLRRALLALPLLAAPALPRAQTLTQNVRLIVPFAPGGTVDVLARLLAEAMTPKLGGRAVVVENRSGAGTFIAMQAMATAPADGHTLLLASNTVLATAPNQPGHHHADRSRPRAAAGGEPDQRADRARRQSAGALPHPAGADRLCEGEPGRAEHRPCRDRRADALLAERLASRPGIRWCRSSIAAARRR